MGIKAFSPCNDWFFVFEDPQGNTVNYRLAGWAVCEEGNGDQVVVGMVPVEGGGNSPVMPGQCRLALVPPIAGIYKHASEITLNL